MIKRNPKRLIIGFAAAVVILFGAVVSVPYSERIFVPSFDSTEEFASAWESTPSSDRHRLLKWLLGKRPSRHAQYAKTRLNHLTRGEVKTLLGMTGSEFDDCMFYDVGSIEFNVLDDWVLYWLFPVGKKDHLCVEFDADSRVVRVSTGS